MKMLAYVIALLLTTTPSPFTFVVEHDHLWGHGQGQLTITSEGITFVAEKHKNHSRYWSFSDIQQIKIESPYELEILTYEDVTWQLNQDRKFDLKLIDARITPELVAFLRQKLPAPVVSAVFDPPAASLPAIAAKHQHSLGGGCRGVLTVGAETIYYTSVERADHSRAWPVKEIDSLGRMSDFNLRLSVREEGSTRNFQFQLQERMDSALYERLWRTIYEPESWLSLSEPERLR